MKRLLTITLALLLILSGCGDPGSEPTDASTQTPTAEPTEGVKALDMQAIYDSFLTLEDMPEMIPLDETMMLNYCGIQAADCVQAVVAVCSDGLRTDEVWLLEAVDEAALGRLEELAQNRLQAKADESQSYSPEQYAVVQKAQVIRQGNYLIVLVSPIVDTLVETYQNAA